MKYSYAWTTFSHWQIRIWNLIETAKTIYSTRNTGFVCLEKLLHELYNKMKRRPTAISYTCAPPRRNIESDWFSWNTLAINFAPHVVSIHSLPQHTRHETIVNLKISHEFKVKIVYRFFSSSKIYDPKCNSLKKLHSGSKITWPMTMTERNKRTQ